MNACDCPHDVRVFGHVWPCPHAERHAPPPDRAAALLAVIRHIQSGRADQLAATIRRIQEGQRS